MSTLDARLDGRVQDDEAHSTAGQVDHYRYEELDAATLRFTRNLRRIQFTAEGDVERDSRTGFQLAKAEDGGGNSPGGGGPYPRWNRAALA